MRRFTTIARTEGPLLGQLTLDFHQRQKVRFRAALDGGEEVAVLLPRGTTLRDGTRIEAEDGSVIEIRAAQETLSVASTPDPLLLTRAAYHLGNRHVPVQVEPGRLLYGHDHVLDGMLQDLGLSVGFAVAPFEPEPGAYGRSGKHHHGHGHEHA